MELANGPYNTPEISSNESAKTLPSNARMRLALPGEFRPSNMTLICPDRVHACTGPGNSKAQITTPVPESWTSPSHGVASGKEIAFHRDRERSAAGTGFEDPPNGEDLMVHMAKITLELLQGLSARNADGHVKGAVGQQRRSDRFAQKARRARRWIYRSVQQKGLTIVRQQIQKLEQNLDGQAEPSPAMAGGIGTVWALAQRYPISIRIPSTLALVMRFLPEGVKRSINLRDRADLARVFMALVNCWLSEAGREGALATRGTMKPLPEAKPGKIVEVE